MGHNGLRERALINGVATPLADALMRITDHGVARGDGAFETVGVWGGVPFRLTDHLARLAASLRALALQPADLDLIAEEAARLVDGVAQDAALRIYVTGSGARALTLAALPVRPDPRVLVPQPAPWVRPVGEYALAGAKLMSYGPNMAATRHARAAGADDALLCSVPEGTVLEGPTFGLVFMARGVMHVPAASLGIVDSISRRTLVEIAVAHGLDVLEGAWGLKALGKAEEVIVSSSLRDAIAVERIGEMRFSRATPVRDMLSLELDRRRRGGAAA